MIAKHVDINKATEFGKFIKEKTSYEFVYKSLAGIFLSLIHISEPTRH